MAKKESNNKRQIILEAAKKCFIEKGFKETSMQDISKEAQVSIGTLYKYFNNKRILFDELNIPDLEDKRPAMEKRKQEIIQATLRLISENSFDKVTMEGIAASLGYSKAYLYSYFENKEDLFSQILSSSIFNTYIQSVADYPEKYHVEDVIESMGRSYLKIFETPERLALFKMVIHDAQASPELGRVYYKNAVQKPCDMIVNFFIKHNQETKNKIPDAEELRLLTRTYIGSLQSYALMSNIINLSTGKDSDKYIKMTSKVYLTYLKENGYY